MAKQKKYVKKNITETKNEYRKVKQNPIITVLTRGAIFIAVAATLILTLYIQSNISERRKKYEQIKQQIEDLKAENEELNLTINSNDMSEYMKKIAIEKYGYAYPDEIRFYDKSHN